MERAATLLERSVDWTETVVAGVLTLVIVAAVGVVAYRAFGVIAGFPHVDDVLKSVIKAVLDVFIVIELFRITVAYVRHRDVIGVVLETALVVAAREVVVIEAGAKDPMAGLAVGGIMVAVGITWWLLRHAGACGHHGKNEGA
jgi:uncharacterized membrane protein (DUF373 family)